MASKPDNPGVRKILVPLDGSDSSLKAAKRAIELAKLFGAEIVCVHAVVNPPYMEYKTAGLYLGRYLGEAKRHAEMWYDKVRGMAAGLGIPVSGETILDVASVADSIVKYAVKQEADLIVIGTSGRSGLKRLLLGSVASGVVTHAKCPVMVVR
jgi:nucleotide-binding universal stress UspA family protein